MESFVPGCKNVQRIFLVTGYELDRRRWKKVTALLFVSASSLRPYPSELQGSQPLSMGLVEMLKCFLDFRYGRTLYVS
jgi:hypothetical protein